MCIKVIVFRPGFKCRVIVLSFTSHACDCFALMGRKVTHDVPVRRKLSKTCYSGTEKEILICSFDVPIRFGGWVGEEVENFSCQKRYRVLSQYITSEAAGLRLSHQ